MTHGPPDRPDQLAFNALHTFVSSQWNGYYKALLQVNNVMSIAEGWPTAPRGTGCWASAAISGRIFTCLVTRFGDVPSCGRNAGQGFARPGSMAWELVEEDLRRGFEAS